MPEHSKDCARAPLYLDGFIRQDILSLTPGQEEAEKMRGFSTRQLIYYCIATRLAATLDHARQNSLHYSRGLAENPGDEALGEIVGGLKKIEELCLQGTAKMHPTIEMELHRLVNSLPFSWPEELLEEPESFLAVSHDDVKGVITQNSSGTTGGAGNQAKRIFCTRRDQEATVKFFAAGMRYMVKPAAEKKDADKVALLLSAGGRGGGNLADLFGEAMSRIGVPFMTPSNILDENATLVELEAFGPSCIIGTPRQILSLFRESSGKAALRIAGIKAGLKNALISGDRISSMLNAILQKELGAEIFLHYGMVESGIGTAVECPHKRGGHYRESDLFIEIIDPDGASHPCPMSIRPTVYVDPDDIKNGRIYGPTPWGEVTITTLSREANPLIRYRTGDSGRIIVDRCACGSELWRLDVRGRLDDYIELQADPGESIQEAPHIEYTSFESCLYSLPWVKDYQVSIYNDESGTVRDLGVTALLSELAPQDCARAARAMRVALAPVAARALAHGVNIHIRPVREREEFLSLFNYSPKRSFPRISGPLDPALYVS